MSIYRTVTVASVCLVGVFIVGVFCFGLKRPRECVEVFSGSTPSNSHRLELEGGAVCLAEDSQVGGSMMISHATPYAVFKALWDGKGWDDLGLPTSGWQDDGTYACEWIDRFDVANRAVIPKQDMVDCGWDAVVDVATGKTNFTGTAIVWHKSGDKKEAWIGRYQGGVRVGLFCLMVGKKCHCI